MPDNQPPPAAPPASGGSLDLSELAGRLTVQVATENPEKTAHELQQAAADGRVERWKEAFKDVALFLFALGGVALIGKLCYAISQSAQASADDKKWAMSTLTLLVGGAVGYVTGKKSK